MTEIRGYCRDCHAFYNWDKNHDQCPYCRGNSTEKHIVQSSKQAQNIMKERISQGNGVFYSKPHSTKTVDTTTIIVILTIIAIFLQIAVRVGDYSSDTQNQAVSYRYVGSKNSNIYHKPSCEWAKAISSYNEVWFTSASDDRSHGYRACKVCKP